MKKTGFLVITFSFLAAQSTAQNMLVNPGFDDASQLAGWTCYQTDGTATWITDDRRGSATSGSVQHEIAAASNNRTVSCDQCLPVTEGETYIASLWLYWPDDPDVTQDGSTRLAVLWYSDIDCLSQIDSMPIAIAHFPGSPLDTWSQLRTVAEAAPVGTVSARIIFLTWQDLADEPVRARIDDVWFAPYRYIFLDGFESGGTGNWSMAIP